MGEALTGRKALRALTGLAVVGGGAALATGVSGRDGAEQTTAMPASAVPSSSALGPVGEREIRVENFGGEDSGRTLRVVSSRHDLGLDQNELDWVADTGEAVGESRCSQRFQLSNEPEPARKPNLLICWRTSPTRSVYTMMVDFSGRPSRTESVAEIAKRWDALG